MNDLGFWNDLMSRQRLQRHFDGAGTFGPAGAPGLGTSNGTISGLWDSSQSGSRNATGGSVSQTRGTAEGQHSAPTAGLDFQQLLQSFLAQNAGSTDDGQAGFPTRPLHLQQGNEIWTNTTGGMDFQQILQSALSQPFPSSMPPPVTPIPMLPLSPQSTDPADVGQQHPLAPLLATPQGVFQLWQQSQQPQANQQPQWQPFLMQVLQLLGNSPPGNTNPYALPQESPANGIDMDAILSAFLRSFSYYQSQPPLPLVPPFLQNPASSPSFPSIGPASTAVTSTASSDPAIAVPAVASAQGAASLKDNEGDGTEVDESTEEKPPKKKRKYNHEAFPQKLHRLIIEAEATGKDNIVKFTPNGLRFQILDTKGFEEILPSYFRHGKITSFKRLLHMYDFKRVQGTWNEGTFGHEKFRRDEPGLLPEVVRVDRGYGAMY